MIYMIPIIVVLMICTAVNSKNIDYNTSNAFTLINGTGLNFQTNKRQLFPSSNNILGHAWRFRNHVNQVEECNLRKECPKGQFCDVHTCRACLKEGENCHYLGTCCGGECQYGRCVKGIKAGATGTYCDRAADCTDKTSCCIREITVSPRVSLCKPMLDEHESCGPINLFHQIYSGGKVEPACGPCKPGLLCKNVGIKGLHFICLKE